MFPIDAYGEGLNGQMHCEEVDVIDSDNLGPGAVCWPSKPKPFIRDRYYYHVELFDENEPHEIVHETEKAVLFEVPRGEFWVPKALMCPDYVLVHLCFRRHYLGEETDDEVTVGAY